MVIFLYAMKTIPAGKFKAQCLALIDDVHERGEEVVITKRGKAMARLVPVEEQKSRTVLGALKGQIRVVGDIVSPITESWEWDEDVFPPGSPDRQRFARPNQQKQKKRSAP